VKEKKGQLKDNSYLSKCSVLYVVPVPESSVPPSHYYEIFRGTLPVKVTLPLGCEAILRVGRGEKKR
jgi:hypothetical protein